MNGFFGEINQMLDRYLTPAVKKIFLINVILGLVLIVLVNSAGIGLAEGIVSFLALSPYYIIHRFYLWQFVTYMFVHFEIWHLLFNMMVLWFFAPDLEQRWGTRRFWRFYLITGTGAGLLHFIVSMALLFGFHQRYETGFLVGASGALYGVMLAFAAYNPEALLLVWGVFPIKAKYLMAIMIFAEFMFTASGTGRGVSNLTHLSGLLIAYIWLSLYHRDWDIRHWRWR